MTIEALNSVPEEGFVISVGWVFEHSPWVAARTACERPFESLASLRAALIRQVEIASPGEQLALLCAHPDLGTRARLSEASSAEQSGAGLDTLTHEEFDRFSRLNESYRAKFGFPFLFAVKGSTKHDILRALEARLASNRTDEFAEALRQVYRIAEFRLDEYIQQEQ